jgi:cation diffusion facilitator CzcD-associated flavoprotein CzcO
VWFGARFGPGLLDHGVLVAIAGACWCRAAWRAKPTPSAAEEEHAEEPDEEEPADRFAVLRQAVTDRLQQWIGDRPGIHLAEVYERYRELPRHEHLTDDQIRAALTDHYRIPVRRAVRDPYATVQPVRAGIHRDDLKPLPSPEETAPVAEPVATGVTSAVAA